MHKVTSLNRYEMKLLEEYIKNIDRLKFRLNIRKFELLDTPKEENLGNKKTINPSSPIEREIAIYLEDDYYNNLDKIIKAVESVYNHADEDTKKIFKLKYWEPKLGIETWEDIAKQLHCSKTSVLRVREHYLKQIAERIDFVNLDF